MTEIAEHLIATATKELGVTENPAGSNNVKYNTWFYGYKAYGPHYPWCMTFLQFIFSKCGVVLPAVTASCGELMRSAQKEGLWFTEDFKPGDAAIMDLSGNKKTTQHCGLITGVSENSVTTIEGNTSERSSQDNGGCVCSKARNNRLIIGVVRAKKLIESGEKEMQTYKKIEEVPVYYRPSVKAAIDAGILLGESKDNLGLNETLCKVITILDRAGVIKRGVDGLSGGNAHPI